LTYTHAHVENESDSYRAFALVLVFGFVTSCLREDVQWNLRTSVSHKIEIARHSDKMYIFLTHCVGILAGRSAPVALGQLYGIPLDIRVWIRIIEIHLQVALLNLCTACRIQK